MEIEIDLGCRWRVIDFSLGIATCIDWDRPGSYRSKLTYNSTLYVTNSVYYTGHSLQTTRS